MGRNDRIQLWQKHAERAWEVLLEERRGGVYGSYQRASARLTAELGESISVDSLRQFAMLRRRAAGEHAPRSARSAAIDDFLDLPVRPFASTYVAPSARSSQTKDRLTAVLYGDTHEPFADPSCLSVVWQIISDVQPDIVIHMGDLVDCYTISRFDKDPVRLLSLQDEIDAARAHLLKLREIVPTSRIVLLEGNHEDRLRRAIYAMQGAPRALAALKVVQTALAWPVLLDLASIGVEFVPLHEQSSTPILPKFLTTHGTRVHTRSGYTARHEHDKYGISGASGHTHRKATHYHRDHNGNHVWIETGCTCTLGMDYTVDPDWQQGCNVVHFNTRSGAFNIEDVYVHNGNANWRGRDYDASAPAPSDSRRMGRGEQGSSGGGRAASSGRRRRR
jgi:predicted phosphodiesterase